MGSLGSGSWSAPGILPALPYSASEAYVFCKKDGNPYNFGSLFVREARKAGIKDLPFHDLRHAVTSYLVMEGDLGT